MATVPQKAQNILQNVPNDNDWMPPRQAASILQISERTIVAWIHKGWLDAQSSQTGKKPAHLVSLSQARAVAVDRHLSQMPSASEGAVLRLQSQYHALLRRVETLEALVKKLSVSSVPYEKTAAENAYSASEGIRRRSLIAGAVSQREAARLAVVHGANSEASARDWAFGEALVSEDAVIRFIWQYLAGHPRSGVWRECDAPECSCHSLEV